jgi:hypothetical protein
MFTLIKTKKKRYLPWKYREYFQTKPENSGKTAFPAILENGEAKTEYQRRGYLSQCSD